MLFKRKGWLRQEYDDKLLTEIQILKKNWNQKKFLLEKSVEPSEELYMEAKMAEVKYFSLFKEAKQRRVTLNR
ncbi:MAG: YaaL family protein [Bacillus sp. (in: firmicutes)]